MIRGLAIKERRLMGLRMDNKMTGLRGIVASFLLASTVCLGGIQWVPATIAYADAAVEPGGDDEAENSAQDTAGLEDDLRTKSIEERIKMYAAQQSDDREVDFLSVCCESGELDVDMTITYANEEPTKAYRPDYLYVRLDVDGEEGFKWLSPVVDPENSNTLSYSFFLSAGRRAAFWIFDYPKDRVNETPPSLSIKVTDRQGKQVFGSTAGSFRSDFEAPGDGSFYLSNARVNEDAEDKAGLPNAKIIFSVPPDPETNSDDGGNEDNPPVPESPEDGDENGDNRERRKINWDDKGPISQLGDAVVPISIIAIVLSLISLIIVISKRK